MHEEGIGLVVGDPGLGKSFACNYFVERLGAPHRSILLGYLPGPHGLVREVWTAVNGTIPQKRAGRANLAAELRTLVDRPMLVHLDEAQQLRGVATEQLRSLVDTIPNLRILLSGGPELAELMTEVVMLQSRTAGTHVSKPLALEDVLEAMPHYHPIYRGADEELLARIDDWARGRFREWAKATIKAHRICNDRRLDRIDDSVVDTVLKQLPRF
jgi:AAA domain